MGLFSVVSSVPKMTSLAGDSKSASVPARTASGFRVCGFRVYLKGEILSQHIVSELWDLMDETETQDDSRCARSFRVQGFRFLGFI